MGLRVRRAFPILLRLWLASAGTALACRYSVRDTGFVDLGNSPVRLEFSSDSTFPEDARRALGQAATAVLLDSNISFTAIPAAGPGEVPLMRLVDAEGRTLPLAAGLAVPRTATEAVRWFENVTTSPMRERLHRESLRAYAVVILIEGANAQANARAGEAAQSAIASVARLIPGMPKPVDVPPQLVVLPQESQAAEAVLLWGLGFEPAPATDPRLAIVYGRGRRLGAGLEGPLITETVLRERLVMVGQDCECDLDRAWLRGPMIPGRWDRTLQESAAKALGFDPENPVVRAEVSRIIERGPQPGQRRKTAGTSQALGYSEDAVDILATAEDVPDLESQALDRPLGATPAAVSPPPGPESELPVGSSTSPLWWLLGGGLATAFAAGGWLAIRSSGR